MIQYLSLYGSSNKILHPFTLKFRNPELKVQYLNNTFEMKYHLIFSIIEMVLSIIVSIITIILYARSNSTINNLRLFLGLLIIVFIMLDIIFIFNGKKCIVHKNLLFVYSSAVQISCCKMIFYLYLSIIKYEYADSYGVASNFLYIVECYLIFAYIIFVDDIFLVHFMANCVACFFVLVLEVFLVTDKVQFSYIFLYFLIESLLGSIVCYFYQKRQKLKWFDFYTKLKDENYYSKIFSSDSIFTASFSANNMLNELTQNLLKVVEKTDYKEELHKLMEELAKNEENGKNNSMKQISLLIQKILFSQIQIKNEELILLLREQIDALQKVDTKFEERIKTTFYILRENQQLFKNMYYIGTINIKKEEAYSVFLQVDKQTNSILYIAVGLDFPIVFSKNLDLLNKVATLGSKVTHEIKNPLAAMKTLITEIKPFFTVQHLANKLDTIYNYSEYMQFIAKDFEFFALKLNKLSENKIMSEIDIKRVQVLPIVTFAVDLIENIWKNKNSKVVIKKNFDDVVQEYINTDEIRVKQIIINLLSNSFKFTKIGSVTLTCRKYGQDHIFIMVSDTGLGMKESLIKALNVGDTLFLKSNDNSNKMGSGLGLSIVKEMVKLLGKDFQVESKYSEGTRISFLLNKNLNMNVPAGDDPPQPQPQSQLQSQPQTQVQPLNNHESGIEKKHMNFTEAMMKPDSFSSTKQYRLVFTKKNPVDASTVSTGNFNNSTANLLEEKTKREDYVLLKPSYQINEDLVKDISPALTDSPTHLKKEKEKENQKESVYASQISGRGKQRMSIITKKKSAREPKEGDSSDCEESSDYAKGKMKKIYGLVVEDDNILKNANIKVLTDVFQERNVDVKLEKCSDGIECIYKIYKGFDYGKKYQFIVTDEIMGTMDGTMMSNIIMTLIEEQRMYPITIFLSSGCLEAKPNVRQVYQGVFPKPLTRDNCKQIFNDLNI